jgi:phage repressor protein C with HTH and peptisase S24 domain
MPDEKVDDALGHCGLHENYAAQVLDDSMEPEFPQGCVVIISPANACYNGAYIFVEVEGVRWFRQYLRDTEGSERLVALNDLYPEIELTHLDWKVLGVVVQRNIKRKIKHYHPLGRGDELAIPLS